MSMKFYVREETGEAEKRVKTHLVTSRTVRNRQRTEKKLFTIATLMHWPCWGSSRRHCQGQTGGGGATAGGSRLRLDITRGNSPRCRLHHHHRHWHVFVVIHR